MGKVHGKTQVLRVLEVASAISESVAESWAKAELIEMGLDFGKVKQNPKLQIEGRERRPDFLYEDWLAIEIDGKAKYDGSYGDPIPALQAERRREKQFLNAGFTLVRAEWADLKSGQFRVRVADALRRHRR
ncbi:hypothetical protein [Corynebacterium sp. H130]|uniref:hypothetical protein n=1 Tax=Corynebacterium sp. H130 TaxID=3133444 RepID=UPI0030AC1486